MAKKSYQKKKDFKAFCRNQVRLGLINNPDGNWGKPASNSMMAKHCFDGYHFNRR